MVDEIQSLNFQKPFIIKDLIENNLGHKIITDAMENIQFLI